MFDFVGLTSAAALTAVLVWLGVRAWRAQRKMVKWVGTLGAGLGASRCPRPRHVRVILPVSMPNSVASW